MPDVVTHVIIAIVIIDIIRHFVKNKKAFPLYYIFIGGLAGLLPDADVFVEIIGKIFGATLTVHRIFTHTLVIPIILVIAGILTMKIPAKKDSAAEFKLSNILFVIALGWGIHLLLDFFIEGNIFPLWPFSGVGFGLNPNPSAFFSTRILPVLDGLILLAWLWHEEATKKITDFF